MPPDTARLAACELTEHDALGPHMRDEPGLTEELAANPMQAAIASGATFRAGEVPHLAALLTPPGLMIMPDGHADRAGGLGHTGRRVRVWPALVRVLLWGSFAMAVTSVIGHLFGAAV